MVFSMKIYASYDKETDKRQFRIVEEAENEEPLAARDVSMLHALFHFLLLSHMTPYQHDIGDEPKEWTTKGSKYKIEEK